MSRGVLTPRLLIIPGSIFNGPLASNELLWFVVILPARAALTVQATVRRKLAAQAEGLIVTIDRNGKPWLRKGA